jgi:hypothetical protein
LHHRFIPGGVTLNKEQYKDVLANLQVAICLKHAEVWAARDWVLLQQQQLTKQCTVVYPLHSLDCAPTEGCQSKSAVEVHVDLRAALYKHWQKCVVVGASSLKATVSKVF